QNDPSLNTAEFSVAKKLSVYGTTDPKYFSTNSGCSRTASENEQKITPASASLARNVVATETESKIASTATWGLTPASNSRSRTGTPSFSYTASSSGSTSSRLFGPVPLGLGAE